MLGAIIGDVLGSYYEFRPSKREDIPLLLEKSRFTDDTVMTLAVGLSVMNGYANETLTHNELIKNMHAIGEKYYKSGYGVRFIQWLLKKVQNRIILLVMVLQCVYPQWHGRTKHWKMYKNL